MDLQLRGRRAVVTGSTAGIGYAIAEALAREGAAVVINGRTSQRVTSAMDRLRGALPKETNITGVAADLGTAAGVEQFLRQVPSADILINNLGIFDPKPFEQIPDAEWFRFFEVNVMSGVRLSRAYLPAMRKNNWGRIIFVSSESAVQIPAEMIHYGMTKTAQLAIARGLAESVAGTGVTVNSVLLWPTRSEGVEQFVSSLAKNQGVDESQIERDFFQHMRPSSLLKRFITPEEVAATVTYLCSPLASATTGAAVRADGGVVRSIV
jgi:NAD(P)-dependent dehydrogenase (short-subunit alcohol dehydrogenase family)